MSHYLRNKGGHLQLFEECGKVSYYLLLFWESGCLVHQLIRNITGVMQGWEIVWNLIIMAIQVGNLLNLCKVVGNQPPKCLGFMNTVKHSINVEHILESVMN